MRKDISVGGVTIPCEANAFTPILYRQIFRRDFMAEMQSFAKLKGKKSTEYTDEDKSLAFERSSAFSCLAFTMKEQATGKSVKDLVKLTELDYYEWLATFEPMAFEDVNTITNIITLWRGNAEDNHVARKNA